MSISMDNYKYKIQNGIFTILKAPKSLCYKDFVAFLFIFSNIFQAD